MKSLTLEIEKMVYGGQGMGRSDGKVIFVPFTAPGDRVEIEVTREKKNYAEAVPREFVLSSPVRVKPFSEVFGECGGCQYQHLPYPEQLMVKETQVKEILGRLSRKGPFQFLPIIPSPDDRGYRVRAQFKAGTREGRRALGFYSWRTHQVVDIRQCPLLHPVANGILGGLRKWMNERGHVPITGADVQVSPTEGMGVVSLSVQGQASLKTAEEVGDIPGVKGVAVMGDGRISWGDLTLLYDWPKIGNAEELHLRIPGESFIQVNPRQNFNLMREIVEWAGLTGKEKVLDLFCGSGNFTLPLAQKAGKVWGVDQDRQAVEYAEENARTNRLSNCTFFAATAEEGIRRVALESGPLDLVVLDPPRVGAYEVLKPLAAFRPRQIIYVSCEPPTLARDLGRLIDSGYRLEKIQPLDMFPQTYHVEVLANLYDDTGG